MGSIIRSIHQPSVPLATIPAEESQTQTAVLSPDPGPKYELEGSSSSHNISVIPFPQLTGMEWTQPSTNQSFVRHRPCGLPHDANLELLEAIFPFLPGACSV